LALLPLAGVTVAKTKVPSNYDAQLWEQQLSFDKLTACLPLDEFQMFVIEAAKYLHGSYD